MSKKYLSAGIILIVGMLIAAKWLAWRNGEIVAESESQSGYYSIAVRSVPLTGDVLTALSGMYSRIYRCELYRQPHGRMVSSQSYSEDSYIAQNVKVRWKDDSEASVYFDHRPILHLQNEMWDRISSSQAPP